MNTRTSKIAQYLKLTASQGLRDGCVTAQQYSEDMNDEYRCVRSSVGLIDLDHYAKIKITGEAAFDLVDRVILTDLARLPVNQLQLTFLLDEQGRSYAEAYVANFGDYYLLLAEGSASENIFARIAALADAHIVGAAVIDQTADLGLIGVDGPYSWELLKSFMGIGIIGTRYLEILPDQSLNGMPFTLCRAGKTGEYGYMLVTRAADTIAVWEALRELGRRFDALPLGYQVIDICKLENRFVSQHNEGTHAANIIELNTRVMVSREKGDYVGIGKCAHAHRVGRGRRRGGRRQRCLFAVDLRRFLLAWGNVGPAHFTV